MRGPLAAVVDTGEAMRSSLDCFDVCPLVGDAVVPVNCTARTPCYLRFSDVSSVELRCDSVLWPLAESDCVTVVGLRTDGGFSLVGRWVCDPSPD